MGCRFELRAVAETERERHRQATGNAEMAWAADQAAGLEDNAEIARLANLTCLDYERERETAATRLGCRVSILDNLVEAKRGKKRGNGAGSLGQGRPLDLPEPEPWPVPVDGAVLLDGLARAIRQYVVLDPREADAVALWVLAAHAFDAWVIFPRLFVTAPERECGKSTLLDALSRLVPRPLDVSNVTAASLFRTIEAARPTLLLDEAETYVRENEELRGVLDAGHRRDGAVIRLVGDNHEPRQFSCWAPVALAAIGRLPGTVEDRAIAVRLRRRRPDEPIQSFRLDRASGLEDLARMAARWAVDNIATLAAADPEMPTGIYNRAADNWRPLLAVADLADGGWPARARRAVSEFMNAGDNQDSTRITLLADIRAAFVARETDRISSEDLVSYLADLDDRLWPEFKNGKPITKAQVARLLKPLRISPGTVRFNDRDTAKGYYRKAFDDAFCRYLPSQTVTTSQSSDSTGFVALQSVTVATGVTDGGCENTSISAGCDCVTDEIPLPWREKI